MRFGSFLKIFPKILEVTLYLSHPLCQDLPVAPFNALSTHV
jgi:hypothetical protein